MPGPLTRTLRAYAADARAAASAAPVEVALGVLLAVALSVQVRSKGFTEGELARLAASVALAFPLVFALSVLRARGVITGMPRWTGTAAVLVLCALFGGLALHDDRAAEWWRWFLLAGAAVMLLVTTPSLPWRGRDRRASWAFAWRLVVRTVGVGLYSAALYAVLAGAVAAVVSLFGLDDPEHLYADLAGAVFFAFAPWILVGGIRHLSAPAEPGVPLALSRLGRWLYTPVLVIYLLILYAYALKVLATGELPRNLVSPLVIAAGLIGLLGAVLLEPVHGDEEHRGVSLLARAVPALLLPLVPLAAWALLARLGEYGWTEFRYVRLAAVVSIGVLAVLGTVRLIRRRPPLLTTVPAVFAAVLLLSAVGPWSAPAVSRRDQTARLRSALREARIDPRVVPRDTVVVDSVLAEQIGSGARYLAHAHGIGALRAVVPWLPDSTRGTWGMSEVLGVRGGCRDRVYARGQIAWEGGVAGVAGGTVWRVSVSEADTARTRIAGTALRLWLDGDRVVAEAASWRAEADLSRVRRAVEPGMHCASRWGVPPAAIAPRDALLALRDASGALRGQLLLTELGVGGPQAGGAKPSTPGIRVRMVEAMLVLPQP